VQPARLGSKRLKRKKNFAAKNLFNPKVIGIGIGQNGGNTGSKQNFNILLTGNQWTGLIKLIAPIRM